MIGRDFHWLPVTADLKASSVSGLPDGWKHLSEILIEEAERRAPTLSTIASSAVWSQRSSGHPAGQETGKSAVPEWSITLTVEDFLHGNVAHEDYLRQVLQSATSSVLIASAFVTTSRLEAIGDAVADALHRGVSVDLLWGYGAEREALNWLVNQAADAKKQAWPGRLRFNRTPSESHAKLLIWDRTQGQFEACVGSCNWLSFRPAASTANQFRDVSVKVLRRISGAIEPVCSESVRRNGGSFVRCPKPLAAGGCRYGPYRVNGNSHTTGECEGEAAVRL